MTQELQAGWGSCRKAVTLETAQDQLLLLFFLKQIRLKQNKRKVQEVPSPHCWGHLWPEQMAFLHPLRLR